MRYRHVCNYNSISQKGHRFAEYEITWIIMSRTKVNSLGNQFHHYTFISEFSSNSICFFLFFRSLGKSSPTRYIVNKYRQHEGNILIKDIRYLERKSEKNIYITIAYIFVWLIFDLLHWFGTKSSWLKTAEFLKKR